MTHDPDTARFENSVGEALIALGLYSACFEAMTSVFREKTRTWLELHGEPGLLREFGKKCSTAERTFQFCGPLLVNLGIINEDDLARITTLRRSRNEYVHESFDHILTMTLATIDSDLTVMAGITERVQYWLIPESREAKSEFAAQGHKVSFLVEPSLVTRVVRAVAVNLVAARMRGDEALPQE